MLEHTARECIRYIPEYSGKYVFSCKFLKKSLKSGMIKFNYLDFWFSTFWHVFLPFSTWKNVLHVEKGKKHAKKWKTKNLNN